MVGLIPVSWYVVLEMSIEVCTYYITSDGKKWDNKGDAESHESWLSLHSHLVEEAGVQADKAAEFCDLAFAHAGAVEYRLRHYLGLKL